MARSRDRTGPCRAVDARLHGSLSENGLWAPPVDAACGLLAGAILLLSVTSVTMLGLVIARHIPVRSAHCS